MGSVGDVLINDNVITPPDCDRYMVDVLNVRASPLNPNVNVIRLDVSGFSVEFILGLVYTGTITAAPGDGDVKIYKVLLYIPNIYTCDPTDKPPCGSNLSTTDI